MSCFNSKRNISLKDPNTRIGLSEVNITSTKQENIVCEQSHVVSPSKNNSLSLFKHSQNNNNSISQYKQLQMNQFLNYCNRYLNIPEDKSEKDNFNGSPADAIFFNHPASRKSMFSNHFLQSYSLPEDLVDIQCADLLYSDGECDGNEEIVRKQTNDLFLKPCQVLTNKFPGDTRTKEDLRIGISGVADINSEKKPFEPPPNVCIGQLKYNKSMSLPSMIGNEKPSPTDECADNTNGLANAARLYYKDKGVYGFRKNFRQILNSDRSGHSKLKKQKCEKLFLNMLKSPKCENWVLESVKASKKDDSINLENLSKRNIKIIGDVSSEELKDYSEDNCGEAFVYCGGSVSPQKPSAVLIDILNDSKS